MKTGQTLQSLAALLMQQAQTKHDYMADTRKALLTTNDSGIKMTMALSENDSIFDVTDLCHGQIGQHTKIPKPYYDRMRTQAPELLVRNVNHWFEEQPATRMIRTMDGNARAFLSDRYRPLDNVDLMEAVYPSLEQTGLNIASCELTERRLYLKAISPKVQGEVKKGDVVQAGVVISNSEVGSGALSVQPLIYRLVCLNGMIRQDHQMRQVHAGSKHRNGAGDAWELFSDATKLQSDKAVFMQARDLAQAFLKEDFFNKVLEELRSAADDRIESDDIPKVVERTSKTMDLTEAEGDSVLKRLAEGGDLTRWGLANAITSVSQDIEDYDRATELERAGGKIIELAPRDWSAIAAA